MDIKEKIEEIVAKVKGDKNLKEKFEKNPVKAVEDIIGIDLPDEIIEKIIDGAKAKLSADMVGDIASKIGGIFGKK